MSEPKVDRAILFNENNCFNFRLAEIGYNDFRVKKTLKLFHVRSEYIIHYVRNGKGTLHIGKKAYSVKEGEFFLVPANIPIMYYPDEIDPWRYYWFSLHGDAAPEIAKMLNLNCDCPVHSAVSVSKTVQIFDDLLSSPSSGSQLYYLAHSALMEILAISQSKNANTATTRNVTDITANIKEIIELNYDNPEFSIDAVSKLLYISHSYMCKIFKEQMHCTPIAYLIDIRLSKAAKKLTQRSYSVKELCEAVGFSDEPYFMKRFKQKYGVTVREYRRQHSNIE